MAFENSFAALLEASGINVDPVSVPDRTAVLADLDSLAVWLDSLEADTRLAIDEVTANNPVQALLGGPDVGLVSEIGPILEAFDNQPSSISISATVNIIAAAAQQAED